MTDDLYALSKILVVRPIKRVLDFIMRALPSLAGGGNRGPISTKISKSKSKGKAFFIIQPKESWTHDFCLLSNTEQDKTPSQESLVALNKAELSRKKHLFSRTKVDQSWVIKQNLE